MMEDQWGASKVELPNKYVTGDALKEHGIGKYIAGKTIDRKKQHFIYINK